MIKRSHELGTNIRIPNPHSNDSVVPGMIRRIRELVNTGIIHALAVRGVAAIVTLLLVTALSYVLTAYEFGLYSMIMSVSTFLSFLILRGQHMLAYNELSAEEGDHRIEKASQLLRYGLSIIAKTCLAVVLVSVIAVATLRYVGLYEIEWTVLASIIALASLFAISEWIGHISRTEGYNFKSFAPKEIYTKAAVLVASLCVFTYFGNLAFEVIVWFFLIFQFAAICLQAHSSSTVRLTIKRRFRASDSFDRGAGSTSWTHRSNQYAFSTLLPSVSTNLSVLLIGAFMSPILAGQLFIATRYANALLLPLNAMNGFSAPHLRSAYVKNDTSTTISIVRRSAVVSCLLAVAGMLLMLFLLQLLSTHSGSITDDTITMFVIVALGRVFSCACGPTGIYLMMTESSSVLPRLQVLAESVSVALIVVALLQESGLLVAVALAGGTVILNSSILIYCRASRLPYFRGYATGCNVGAK